VSAVERRVDDGRRIRPDARIDQLVAGLRRSPPSISPSWFYDQRGSALFERICEQPEYYLTRVELSIMDSHVREMAAALGPRVALIEPGSGSGLKTRRLLGALDSPAAYVPVDISREHLFESAARLRAGHPGLDVHPVCADFTASFDVPTAAVEAARRKVVYFPGSTLGNFAADEAVELLRRFARIAGPGGAVLLGLDAVKPVEVLERAYDDAAGVTAAFNLNALEHINRATGATIDPSAFRHFAPWVAARERIEMRLVARRDVGFDVDAARVRLRRGEYLLTEYSHKYTPRSATRLAAEAGLVVQQAWFDPQRWFGVWLLMPGGGDYATATGSAPERG
jgi:L-histidine N-alpha-methyltransferase